MLEPRILSLYFRHMKYRGLIQDAQLIEFTSEAVGPPYQAEQDALQRIVDDVNKASFGGDARLQSWSSELTCEKIDCGNGVARVTARASGMFGVPTEA